jgi:hypothetical protein
MMPVRGGDIDLNKDEWIGATEALGFTRTGTGPRIRRPPQWEAQVGRPARLVTG